MGRSVPLSAATPPPASQPQESFSWSGALALPTYVYGLGGGALSAATGYAQAHPYGGITIRPGEVFIHPEWTRNFNEYSTLGRFQPILAGVACGLALLRGGFELAEYMQSGDRKVGLAGGLDVALGLASLGSIANPAVGGALSLALVGARFVVSLT